MKITKKDWERMLDLVLTDNDGESVAKSIKDADKAAARFICGLKLKGLEIEYREDWRDDAYVGSFSCFANRAVQLGGPEYITRILNTIRRTDVPAFITEKSQRYVGKKMHSMYVSFLSKAIIDAGFDINYLNNGGNAITSEGRYAMERNGRKWTIGYRTEVIIGDTTHAFNFDAITCEGGGPTSYVIDNSSSGIFSINSYFTFGKTSLKSTVLKAIKEAA